WKAAVATKHMQILEECSCHLPAVQLDVNHGGMMSQFVPNEVHVINKSYLTCSFTCTQWQRSIKALSCKFNLNTEQDRAFHYCALHLICTNSDQLKMYIGGMAGTGKSQGLKALMEFFAERKESHHLTVVAPTRSVAALLGGSTYHSMFGINTDGLQINNIQLAQVRSRLEGVQYVFLDEVSMLSCRDM
ncbi:hypothetical protein L208DRAFT_1230847, partial [Tricholoma matsutake]